MRQELLEGLKHQEISALNQGLTRLKHNLRTKSIAAYLPIFTWADDTGLALTQQMTGML